MKGIYVHGYESDNLGGKIKWSKGQANIYNPLIDYPHQTKNRAGFEHWFERYKGYDYYIGSSMGGYLAFYMAMRAGVPCFLINPSLNFKPDMSPFTMPDFALEQRAEISILLGTEDTVIPNVEVYDFIKKHQLNCNIATVAAGHRIELDKFKPHFLNFLKSLNQQ